MRILPVYYDKQRRHCIMQLQKRSRRLTLSEICLRSPEARASHRSISPLLHPRRLPTLTQCLRSQLSLAAQRQGRARHAAAWQILITAEYKAPSQAGFIVPLCPRRAPEGSALGVPHRAALDADFE